MSSIDNRIVSMQFDNKQFQQGVGQTIGSLDNLSNKMDFSSSKKGVADLQTSFDRFGMGGMGVAIDNVTAKFSAMGAIAFTALQNITNKAIDAGTSLIKSLSTDNISSGLKEYETNLNSIQTVLANTSSKGTTLDQVNGALEELNKYSDMTIYNFSEMARNIGTFTAAGVDLDTSVNSIKGIANLAATSGSDANQAATAMYQLSQAISTGTLKLEDWNSVTNAGMGGQVFQDALKETARVHGVSVDEMIESEGSFRESLKKGWITSDVLNETLMKFTGDLNEEQLRTMGYTEDQIAGIIKMGQTATDAATKVKTMTQLMDTLQEGVGSGWAMSWQLILGDFGEAKGLFTEISDSLGGIIGRSAEGRNALLKEWKDLGGRQALIEAFWYGLNALVNVVDTIKAAFREVFPKKTAQDLVNITTAVRDFLRNLMDGSDKLQTFKTIMKGVFSVFSIGWEFVKALTSFLKGLFDTLSEGSSGALGQFLKGIAEWVIGLDQAIKSGQLFTNFFDRIRSKIDIVLVYLQKAGDWLKGIWDQIDFQRVEKELLVVSDRIRSMWDKIDFDKVGEKINQIGQFFKDMFDGVSFKPFENAWTRFSLSLESGRGALQSIKAVFYPVINAWNSFIADIQSGTSVWDALGNVFESARDRIVAVTDDIKAALEPFVSEVERIWGGVTDAFDKVMEKIQPVIDSIKSAFAEAKAEMGAAFSGIGGEEVAAGGAIAIGGGILAAFILIFKKIKDFITGLGDFGLSDLVSSLGETLGALTTHLSALTAQVKAKTLLTIAGAVALLTVSIVALSMIDAEALAKSLTAMAIGFGQLLAAVAILTKIAGMSGYAKIPLIAASMLLLAGAVLILSFALKKLSGMDWESLGRGMSALAGLMILLTGSMKTLSGMSGGIMRTGASMILMALAIRLLANAVAAFATMDWATLGRGMAGVATGLVVMTASMRLMPPNMLANSIGLIAIAGALQLLSLAVNSFAAMDWAYMGKGMAGIAAALVAVAIGMQLMPKSMMAQSVALIAVGAAIQIIAGAISTMGGQSWEAIGKGMATLAGAMVILAGGLKLMTSARAGALSLTVVAVALSILTPVLVTLGNLPWQVLLLALGGLAAVFGLIGVAGLLLKPIVPAIIALGLALIAAGAGMTLFGLGAILVAQSIQILVATGQAGVNMFMSLVASMIAMLPQIVEAVGAAVIQFAMIITAGAPAIVGALQAILSELLAAIVTLAPQLGETVGVLIQTILTTLTTNLPSIVQAGFDLLTGLLSGIADNIADVATGVSDIIIAFLDAMTLELPKIVQAGWDMVLGVIEGISASITDNVDALLTATADLALNIIEGIVVGLGNVAGKIWDKLLQILEDAWDSVLGWFGIASPSKRMAWVGRMAMDGMAVGIEKNGQGVIDNSVAVGEGVVEGMGNSLAKMPDALAGVTDTNPVITPVLDISGVQAEAGKLNGLFNDPSLNTSGTYGQTAAISSEAEASKISAATGAEAGGTTINYEQNNYSPEALPAADIYRNTRSSLALAKEVLVTG